MGNVLSSVCSILYFIYNIFNIVPQEPSTVEGTGSAHTTPCTVGLEGGPPLSTDSKDIRDGSDILPELEDDEDTPSPEAETPPLSSRLPLESSVIQLANEGPVPEDHEQYPTTTRSE